MQKAEAQHNHVQKQPAQRQGGGAAFESPQGEQVAQLEAMTESSPRADKLAQLAEMANGSPALAAQRRLGDMIRNSPRMSIQRKIAEGINSSPYVAAQLKQSVAPNNTGLPDNLKNGIESLSGMSMDNVKVHYNSSQPAQLNALAYAQGTDIHVAPGQEQHLPHEAWHVVQQAQGRVRPTMQMKDGVPVNDDKSLEHEADVMGAKALENYEPGAKVAQRVGASKRGAALLESGTPEVLQRVLNTVAPQYLGIIGLYPDAGSATGKCHDAASALMKEAQRQGQPWNYIWAFCEDFNNLQFGGMEDHVAVESGGTVYDPTLQQFPGVAGGVWVGTVVQWQGAMVRAFRTKFRGQNMNGNYSVSLDISQTWHGDSWGTPNGLAVIGTFSVPSGGGCAIL